MHALQDHDHLATARHCAPAPGITATARPDAAPPDEPCGLEEILNLRVGCWRPPVHLPSWAFPS